MKKIAVTSLSLLILMPAQTDAQQNLPGWESYLKWRDTNIGHNAQGMALPHRCFVAITQRVDDASAQLDFLIVGKRQALTLEIQPLKITRQTDGGYREEKVNGLTENRLQGEGAQTDLTCLRVSVPVTKETNAFEVKWKIDDDGSGANLISVILLEDKPNETLIGLIKK
jgi:hypothetical protein